MCVFGAPLGVGLAAGQEPFVFWSQCAQMKSCSPGALGPSYTWHQNVSMSEPEAILTVGSWGFKQILEM